jgi:thiamine biosynthesis lipoprotein
MSSLGVFGVALLALAQDAGEAGAPRRFVFRQPHMGTEFHIVLYTSDEATARRASDRAFARVAELNAILSDYDPDSELMRLCAQAGGPPVPVGDDLFRVLERALAIAERSGGAFDPTIGPVGRLWRRARRTHRLPDPDDLRRAMERVGYRKVRLDSERRTVQLLMPGMKLDLGGIAKGYAADEALDVLRREGVARAMVAAAGDITAGDPPPGADGWRVAVAALKAPGERVGPSPTLLMAGRAVSTSGDAEQFVEIDSVRYSHILDPHTGIGVRGRSSATVVAPDGTTADVLATTLSVLGPERGMPLVEETGGAAAFHVRVEDDGSIHVVTSRRWADLPFVKPKP